MVLACVATCLVPGDAVAHGGAGGSMLATGAAQVRLLLSDMSQPSQRLPAGVPSWYDWAEHPRVHQISGVMRKFRAFTGWGQLYQCAGSSSPQGTTVDLRDMQSWVLLRASSSWQRIQFSSDLGGAAFPESYAGPTVPGRFTASSTSTAVKLVPRHNFHFWPDAGRVSLNASDIAAVTVSVQARLAPTPGRSPAPCLVLSVGGDVWRSLTAQAGGTSSGDVGIGRFKRVERRWRLFTMTTASAGLLRRHLLPPMAPGVEDF